MEKSDKEKKGHEDRGIAQEQNTEQKQLWEINEVMLNIHYTLEKTAEGGLYTLSTNREDLPARFWHDDWIQTMKDREEAEKLAQSSGTRAQQDRGIVGGQLLSQQIANNPNMKLLSSSASASKKARGK